MMSITHTEYDRLRLAGEPLPNADVLIEPNGKSLDLFLTRGDTVVRTNPRIQARNVRDAITMLDNLTEDEELDADVGQPCEAKRGSPNVHELGGLPLFNQVPESPCVSPPESPLPDTQKYYPACAGPDGWTKFW